MNRWVLFFLMIALLTAIHQYLFWGKFFELKDALHHEVLILVSLSIMGTILALKKKGGGE